MKRRTVVEVMNPDVLVVQEDMSLEELAAFLVDHEIGGAPVEDEEGKLVGVVSMVDLVNAAANGGGLESEDGPRPAYFVRGWEDRLDESELHRFHITDEGRRVRDVMSTEIYSVTEDTPLSEVAMMMMKGHVHRLLVLRDGKAVGIVSTSDLLSLVAEAG